MSDVSVVIPFWDLENPILQDCIDSIRSQAYPSQILVVDNASSIPVVGQDGVKVLRLNKRVSVGEARNLGLATVETPYVMFMDADDVLLPNAIGHLRSLIASRPGVSLAAGRIIDWVPDTGVKRPKPWPGKMAKQINRSARLFRLLNIVRNVTPVTGCAVMDTRLAQSTGGFPNSTAEDWTFGVLMGLRGQVLLSDNYVKLYRWRADGLSKVAVQQWKVLYEARRVTRSALAADALTPSWMRSLLGALALLHVLELPFHVQREQAFSRIGGEIAEAKKAPRPRRFDRIIRTAKRPATTLAGSPAAVARNSMAMYSNAAVATDESAKLRGRIV